MKGEHNSVITIGDIITELANIRNVVDTIEVKGKDNASKLCYIYDKSNDLIGLLNKTVEEIQNGSNNEPQENTTLTEVGEANGELDRDSSG